MENKLTFDEKINFIKEAILKHVPAKYIYLFGSYAYGEPSEDSDIDVYAVIPDEIENNTFLWADINGELREQEVYDIDFHIGNESVFNKFRHLSRFEETIFEKGIILYERT